MIDRYIDKWMNINPLIDVDILIWIGTGIDKSDRQIDI